MVAREKIGKGRRFGRREGRKYKIGKEIREIKQDWEGEKGENTRLRRRDGIE